MPAIEAAGGRDQAFEAFRAAHERETRTVVLLVDAEGPVTGAGTWQHLQSRDGWSRPHSASDDQCHLMVQVMESWFLADADALEAFYGRGFRRQALPRNPNVEAVPKQDVLNGLDRATADTGKRDYDKGKHSFRILATLDPSKVGSASPYAKRLIETLRD